MYIVHSIEGFLVKVSTHGCFDIYTPKMPRSSLGSLDLPSHLYQGDVEELGFEYLPEVDDINIELEDTEECCREYIRQNLAALRAEEIVALKLWEEIKENSPPLTGFGDTIRIGDKVTMVTVGEKADIAPKTEAIEIIYYDFDHHLLFKYLDTDSNPLLQTLSGLNAGFECCLQGPGYRRHFTKIEK